MTPRNPEELRLSPEELEEILRQRAEEYRRQLFAPVRAESGRRKDRRLRRRLRRQLGGRP